VKTARVRVMATILVLDDSPLVLNATREALEEGGHRAITVDDPKDFFMKLGTEKPDLALVDVSMPSLEGDAVVWIARAHELRRCTIALYSAKTEAELQRLVTSSGADGFIVKTPDNDELRAKVTALLERHATRSPPF
jgi:DNA-binding response OmpR family regulator